METPPLHKLLEQDKASALLANFAQTFPGSAKTWLVDTEGHIVGYHPVNAQDVDVGELTRALDLVRQHKRLTAAPIGIATPVWMRGQPVGALVVSAAETLEPHKVAAWQLLARVISLLAENSLTQQDLLREAVDRYQELNLLYRAGETIAASLDLAQVNRLILDESMRLVQADEGAVMLVDRTTGQLTVWASRGLDAVEDIGSGIPHGHELAETVLSSSCTQVFRGQDVVASERSSGTQLCVPLKTKDGVIGIISLAHTTLERTFRTNDISLINALAGQAAIAIDNARMFSDLSALHTELEAANRRLLELNKLKSSFLGVITHELRSPFADIDFSLQLIERYGMHTWSETQQEQWVQLNRGVKEAKRMIDNLISFAGLLSKQGDLNLTSIQFPLLVHDVAETLIPVTRARRLDLTVEGVEQMPPVRADKNRLAEAVYHLVYNAIKFNRPGGKIIVRYWSDNGGIRFEVEDTGMGIPTDKLKLLWDPFSQIADPIKRGKEGLGLGLALVSYVIHAHGGRVGVSSQEGVGSTFRFWLPVDGPGRTPSRTHSHPYLN